MEGFDDTLVRMQTINFSAGHVNAVEFCQTLFGLPALPDLLKAFEAQQAA